jgi:hypothetical protein
VENDFPKPMLFVRPHLGRYAGTQRNCLFTPSPVSGGNAEETEMKLSGVLLASAALCGALVISDPAEAYRGFRGAGWHRAGWGAAGTEPVGVEPVGAAGTEPVGVEPVGAGSATVGVGIAVGAGRQLLEWALPRALRGGGRITPITAMAVTPITAMAILTGIRRLRPRRLLRRQLQPRLP